MTAADYATFLMWILLELFVFIMIIIEITNNFITRRRK